MDTLTFWLDTQHTLVEVFGYPLSFIELFATSVGLCSVYLATKASIYTWYTGLVSQIAFFLIFYQVQLYSDMILQVFFSFVCIFGIYSWRKTSKNEEQNITWLRNTPRLLIVVSMLVGSYLLSLAASRYHVWFPQLFTHPADFAYIDALVSALGITASLLQTQRKIDAWFFWICLNIVCIFLFFHKGIKFVAIEYCMLLMLAIWGMYNWVSLHKQCEKV